MEKISGRLRAHTWGQELACSKAISSSWESGPSSMDLVSKNYNESQFLSQEWRIDRAGKDLSCSTGCILHGPSPQLHSSVSASGVCRNWMGKGKAGPWWFCAPHALTSAKKHWLLCQLPTTAGQGWLVGSFLPMQEQWVRRYGQCTSVLSWGIVLRTVPMCAWIC